MKLLNELNHFFCSPVNTAAKHAMQRISSQPSSADGIEWFFTQCLQIRDDVDEEDLNDYLDMLAPALSAAPAAAGYNEGQGVAEGTLGPLYDRLYGLSEEGQCGMRDSGFGDTYTSSITAGGMDGPEHGLGGGPSTLRRRTSSGNAMTHKLKLMTNIDLGGLKKSLKEALLGDIDDDEDQDDAAQRNSNSNCNSDSDLQGVVSVPVSGGGNLSMSIIKSRIQESNKGRGKGLRRESVNMQLALNQSVVADVSEYLMCKDDDDNEMLGLETYAEDALEEEREEIESRQFSIEGHLEKKSPTSKLWQSRFFKIMTRTELVQPSDQDQDQTQDQDQQIVSYHLMWYKNQGGAVLKSFDLSRLSVVKILDSPRPISFVGKELSKGGGRTCGLSGAAGGTITLSSDLEVTDKKSDRNNRRAQDMLARGTVSLYCGEEDGPSSFASAARQRAETVGVNGGGGDLGGIPPIRASGPARRKLSMSPDAMGAAVRAAKIEVKVKVKVTDATIEEGDEYGDEEEEEEEEEEVEDKFENKNKGSSASGTGTGTGTGVEKNTYIDKGKEKEKDKEKDKGDKIWGGLLKGLRSMPLIGSISSGSSNSNGHGPNYKHKQHKGHGIELMTGEHYEFQITATPCPLGRDPEEHTLTLRCTTVDKMVRWLTAFVGPYGGRMRYDSEMGCFLQEKE